MYELSSFILIASTYDVIYDIFNPDGNDDKMGTSDLKKYLVRGHEKV